MCMTNIINVYDPPHHLYIEAWKVFHLKGFTTEGPIFLSMFYQPYEDEETGKPRVKATGPYELEKWYDSEINKTINQTTEFGVTFPEDFDFGGKIMKYESGFHAFLERKDAVSYGNRYWNYGHSAMYCVKPVVIDLITATGGYVYGESGKVSNAVCGKRMMIRNDSFEIQKG